MRIPIKSALFASIAVGMCLSANAFSMLGPFDTWMTAEVGLNLPVTDEASNGESGGPMNLGEEYRWNSPVITYAFDRSFEYFGTKGIEAVESAIQILNDLPPVSSLSEDLSEYPLNVARINNLATELRLLDIKTTVLSILLEHMGLTAPERFVWQIRQRTATPVPNIFLFNVQQRNFDPVTFEPTKYVNGTRYSYQLFTTGDNTISEATEFELDPSLPNTSVVGISAMQAGNLLGRARVLRIQKTMGLFVNGLTRDDIGGLRYIYRPENVNVEQAPGDAAGDQAGGFAVGGSITQSDSPWGLPGGIFTTNTTATAGTVNTNSTFVYVGLRPGVDKLRFQRIEYDNLASNKVFVVRYPETVITNLNGSPRRVRQVVTRTITRPDILFVAADVPPVGSVSFAYRRLPQMVNNSTLHSGGSIVASGPGNIAQSVSSGGGVTVQAPMEIILTKVGSWNFNIGDTSEEEREIGFTYDNGFQWAILDGSTNAPVIFPNGTSIKEMERKIFGR